MSAYPSRDEGGQNWATFAGILFLIFRGSVLGSLLGITLAALNAVIALVSIGAYPVWSVIILVLDGVVIYALTVHGDALRPTH